MGENIDFIICKICNKKLKRLTNTHLSNHNETFNSYKIKFPGGLLTCLSSRNTASSSLKGKNTWSKGSTRSEETNKKVSEKLKGRLRISREVRACLCGCGQTFECKVNSKRNFINGHSLQCWFRRGGKWTKEQLEKRATTRKQREGYPGYLPNEASRKKQRIARITQIERNYGQCWPNYNPKACEFFKSYDEQNNTKGHYAVYGGGEHYIKELGYFLDYINFGLNLIMEFDEPKHYDENGNLKDKDIIRQKEIQEYFPDFKFERIKEVEIHTLKVELGGKIV